MDPKPLNRKQDAPPHSDERDRALENSTLIVATATSFMGPFMISAVNVALPAIQAEFGASAVLLSWIATAYLLAIAVFLVPFGKVADIYGRRKVFVWGLVLFALATLGMAFAGSIAVLIAWRMIQGIGTAMVVTTGMAIVTSVFPPQRRGKAIGIYVAAVYVGLAVGPTAGGVLTHQYGWRSIFWAMVPLGGLSIYITLRYLRREWKDAAGERLDVVGSLLYGVALVLMMYGATLLPGWVGFAMTVAGCAGLVLFVLWELRVRHPVFEVTLFKENRLFAFSSLAALINYAATFAVTFLLSLYLQYIKGLNPQQAGVILVAQPVVMAVMSPVAGRFSDRIEPRVIASTGMGLTVTGLLLLLLLGDATSSAFVVAVLVLMGFGFALFSSPNMNAIMGAVEPRHFGIASGAVATMRLLGQMISMVIATVVFAIMFGSQAIEPANYHQFLTGIRIIFSICAGLCAMGIFFSLVRGNLRHKRSGGQAS
jgi:EmrB/QacA subfamily drug resistance transporter